MATEYTKKFLETKFGKVEFSPQESLIAGTHFQAEFKVIIGEFGIDDGGHIKIAWPVSNSFGIPQLENPNAQGYIKVICEANAKFKTEFDFNGYIRPFFPAITIKVFDGYLSQGDVISIFIGYQGEGGSGWETQTYVENNLEFLVLLDPFGTNDYENLPTAPFITIQPGPPSKLFMVVKPEITVNDQFWAMIRVDDRYGNAVTDYEGSLIITNNDGSLFREIFFTPTDRGSIKIRDLQLKTIGTQYLKVTDHANNFEATSNPILVMDKPSDLNLYFGDLHGQTGETVGSGTIEEYLEFGQRYAALDFISHAANDFQITIPIWENTQKRIKEFHKPGEYITFLGYEWSGSPPAGGDHNVYYLHDDQPIHRSSHALIHDKSDLDTDRHPVSELYNEFNGKDDVMIIPHIGGRRASLDVFDAHLTPFIEIMSVHGHFEWFAEEALEMGLITGFIASSDTHSGRPGNGFAVSKLEAVKSGLTGVFAEGLSRQKLWDAFKKRHVYGTSGPRIILKFTGNEAMMGDVLKASKVKFEIEAHGTENIEKIDLFKNREVIFSYDPLSENNENFDLVKIQWKGARVKARRRNLSWDVSIEVENGIIENAELFAFDLPWEGLRKQSDKMVKFESSTAGDYDGVILKVSGLTNDTKFLFKSLQGNVEAKFSDMKSQKVFELGEVEKLVEFKRFTRSLKKSVYLTYSVENNTVGHYWVRVTQVDGEKAWSSPIFVQS